MLESRASSPNVARPAFRMDARTVRRYREKLGKAYTPSGAVWWWRDIHRDMSHMVRVSEKLRRAASTLHTWDLRVLIEILSKYEDPLAIATLAPYLSNEDDISEGLEWLEAPCTYKVVALGLQRLCFLLSSVARREAYFVIGEPSPRPAVDLASVVNRIAGALDLRPADEQVDLWWQFHAYSRGFGPHGNVLHHPQTEQVAELLAQRIAGAAIYDEQFGPTTEWLAKNGGMLGVIGLAAGRLHGYPAVAEALRNRYLALMEPELEADAHSFSRYHPVYQLDVNHAALALLVPPVEPAMHTWARLVDRWAVPAGGWGHPHETWSEELRRAGWLLSVGCVAASTAVEKDPIAGRPLADAVLARTDRLWDDWMWHGDPDWLGPLPAYLGLLFGKLPEAECSERAVRYARAARKPTVIADVQRNCDLRLSADARQTLHELVERRNRHQKELEE